MLLKNQWVNEEIKDETRKYLMASENINIIFQNLWDSGKAVLRGKLIAIETHLKEQEKI